MNNEEKPGDDQAAELDMLRIRNKELEENIALCKERNERLNKDLEEQRILVRDKEILLKEIHHRVKNNLQIMSSLLNLQADSTKDPRLRELLNESKNRIRSMALVHERLYQSSDMAYINYDEYLRKLLSHLARSYDRDDIRFVIDTGNVLLNINAAITCGLIVNEIVSNALKHAFPGKREGTIRIRLKLQENMDATLVIHDDGVGIPPEIELKSPPTLGLQLIAELIEQIEGTLELVRNRGTKFTIRFKTQSIELKPRRITFY
jgi:two-component sensor histidine kinase